MNDRECTVLTMLLQDLVPLYQSLRQHVPDLTPLRLPAPFQAAWPTTPEAVFPFRQLAAVIEHVALENAPPANTPYTYYYPLTALSVEQDDVMPQHDTLAGEVLLNRYHTLWQAFAAEVNQLEAHTQFESYFFTLFFLLKQYFSRVPSPEAEDISLFDQARVRTAIADCAFQCRQGPDRKPDTPEFLVIEGDISGIQQFIYNMVSPQQERARLTRRLRGRSFYLLLLTETLADYLLRTLKLTIAHQIWCGGGHFLLLAPNTADMTYHLKSCAQHINTFLLHEFRGELSGVLQWQSASRETLQENFYAVRSRLTRRLEREKTRKLSSVLSQDGDVQFPSDPSTIGESYIAPVDSYVQRLNKTQEEIGKKLARLNTGQTGIQWLITSSQPQGIPEKDRLAEFKIGDYYAVWGISTDDISSAETAYRLNAPREALWGSGIRHYGLKFLACHVDTYRTSEETERARRSERDGRLIRPGEIKGFETLADAAAGGFLAVLRMDVDHLGALFSLGIRQQCLARVAALSSDMDFFFTGYLQHLCHTKFARNIYINYSGGDDLFIVGAWDQLVELAREIRYQFKAYTCQNPDVNISAGMYLCKGKYPIHRAAEAAGHFLDDFAKENVHREQGVRDEMQGRLDAPQRDGIAIFNHRMSWQDFEEMRATGDLLIQAIQGEGSGKMLNRTFLYKLLNLHTTWTAFRTLNTARLYYITLRTIRNPEFRKQLIDRLGTNAHLSNRAFIPMLIGYTALKTRASTQPD